jgi:hypothetical protein
VSEREKERERTRERENEREKEGEGEREGFKLTPNHRVVAKSSALKSSENLAHRRVELR